MKIIEFRSENVKGIKAIEITPGDGVVEITGKNGAGKSSILDAIWLALGGKDASKDVTTALRNGEDSGCSYLDLGTLKVRRDWKSGVTSKVTVKTVTNGVEATVGQAQTTLDNLRALTLDPERFIQLPAKDQRDALLGILDLGIDLDEWQAERDRVYEERAEIGRKGRTLGDVPAIDDDLPKVEQSASEIVGRIREAQDHNREVENAMGAVETLANRITFRNREIESIERQLADARKHLAVEEENHRLAQKKAADLLPKRSTDDLEEQLSTTEDTNARIRANNAAKAKLAEKTELRAQYESATKEIKALDRQKADALNSASVPLDGLGIGTDGITYRDVPLSDVNSADQIEVVLHIIAALNPGLRIVQIRNGSLLDDESFARVRKFAAEKDFQVWVETVNSGHEDAIEIEDGSVAS